VTSAAQRASIRWGCDRRQRSRARLRQEVTDIGNKLRDPFYRRRLVAAIGEREVAFIERANEAMLRDLEARS
jgi:hypothetical protein